MNSFFVKQLNTDKTHRLQESGIYVFLFSKNSRKDYIKSFIEKKYSVKVDDVRTVVLSKKNKSFRGVLGVLPQYKKAYVKLANGMIISSDDSNGVK